MDRPGRHVTGEDHEAVIEAVVIQAINDYTPRDRPWREWKECVARRVAILLSRCPPPHHEPMPITGNDEDHRWERGS